MPFAVTDYDSIGSISYPGEKDTTQYVNNQKTFMNNETHTTPDTRKLGEELDGEKAEGKAAIIKAIERYNTYAVTSQNIILFNNR